MSQGITCASYCPQDSSLLLTSGRDNRTVVWHMGEATTAQGAPGNQDQVGFDSRIDSRLDGVLSGVVHGHIR